LAALLIAPAVPGPLLFLIFGRAPDSAAGDPVLLFLQAWWSATVMFASVSIAAGAIVSVIFRSGHRAPRSPAVIGLFGLVSGLLMATLVLGLQFGAESGAERVRDWSTATFTGLAMAVASMLVALAYCLIAGVPWRAQGEA
jgi:hypothetical protein